MKKLLLLLLFVLNLSCNAQQGFDNKNFFVGNYQETFDYLIVDRDGGVVRYDTPARVEQGRSGEVMYLYLNGKFLDTFIRRTKFKSYTFDGEESYYADFALSGTVSVTNKIRIYILRRQVIIIERDLNDRLVSMMTFKKKL